MLLSEAELPGARSLRRLEKDIKKIVKSYMKTMIRESPFHDMELIYPRKKVKVEELSEPYDECNQDGEKDPTLEDSLEETLD